MQHRTSITSGVLSLALFFCLSAGCNRNPSPSNTVQGYVEGEFVYVSAPLSGRLDHIFVQRGSRVGQGEPLFELESTRERSTRDETGQRLAQVRAQLADARKGRRPTEIDASAAQLAAARTALQFSERELARQEKLLKANVTTAQEVDRIRTQRDQERQRVVQLEAELGTAALGSRSDQIAAAEAGARSLEAVLTRNEWDLAQKRQSAPHPGLVSDILYRTGEWVAAGRPVVVLLPPQNIKVRVFIPQSMLTAVHNGDKVRVYTDGTATPFSGSVSFISPRAEYTPPFIYSRESRQKLVYMVELAFPPDEAVRLHPGQPVSVTFGAGT